MNNVLSNLDRPSQMAGRSSCQSYLAHNEAALLAITTWVHSVDDIRSIFPTASPAKIEKMKTQMNRDIVRVSMMVLANKAFATDRVDREIFSLRQLAICLDRAKAESMQRTLRNWLLPMLSEAGWIDGFVSTENWSTSPHEIEITDKGIDVVVGYFDRLLDDECTKNRALN